MCTHSLLRRMLPEGKKKWVCCAHLKYFLPLLYTQLRHMFNAQMCLSNGKTHLERLKWLWERIRIQERIQNGGHKSALWILGKAEEEFRLSPFLCSCSMLCNDWKSVFPLTAEISSKVSMVPKLRGWQRNQQNPTKQKKQLLFFQTILGIQIWFYRFKVIFLNGKKKGSALIPKTYINFNKS